jgi:hypothetical protein
VSAIGSNLDGEKSHQLIFKYGRTDVRNSFHRYSSDYTAAIILLKYQQEAASTIVNFFYDTSYIWPLGGLRGHIFEILDNTVIASGGPFKCRKLSPDGPAKSTVSNRETAFKISFAVDNVSSVDSME